MAEVQAVGRKKEALADRVRQDMARMSPSQISEAEGLVQQCLAQKLKDC